MIILDLDDTIFETQTMNHKIFDSPISLIENYYRQESDEKAKKVVHDLWTNPVDVVLSKYQTPDAIVEKFYTEISKIDYNELQIETFDDYTLIHELKMPKILVTTGLTELQNAKIDALGIRQDFDSVFIDDPRTQPRVSKFDIFSKILSDSNLDSKDIWVIGDNPESEIQAANRLGMNTIQRKSKSKVESELADYQIDSFGKLKAIIN